LGTNGVVSENVLVTRGSKQSMVSYSADAQYESITELDNFGLFTCYYNLYGNNSQTELCYELSLNQLP
jgi:hypothetical protein